MRIAVSTDDNRGLAGIVSAHFGRCSSYTLIDVKDGEIENVSVVNNPFFGRHEQSGEVPAFIRNQGVDVMITGGMGPKAIGFFNQFGIEVVTGVGGKVEDAINSYLAGSLSGGQPCGRDIKHAEDAESYQEGNPIGFKEELNILQQRLSEIEGMIAQLEQR